MVSEFSEPGLRSMLCSVAGLSICTCGGTWTCKPQGTQPQSSCWHTDLHTCTSQVVAPSSSWPWAASLPWINFLDPLVSSCLTHRDTHANPSLWYPVHIMSLLVANHRSHGLPVTALDLLLPPVFNLQTFCLLSLCSRLMVAPVGYSQAFYPN